MDRREAPGCFGYEVTDTGEVFAPDGSRVDVKSYWDRDVVTVRRPDGRTTTRSVGRMVALAFVPNPDCKSTVAHVNGDVHDNRASNLTWMTRAEAERRRTGGTGLCSSDRRWGRNV